jgi:hypothetical protein
MLSVDLPLNLIQDAEVQIQHEETHVNKKRPRHIGNRHPWQKVNLAKADAQQKTSPVPVEQHKFITHN